MKPSPISVHLPDTRGVTLSPYGSGNAKIGFGVFTYSRLPGNPALTSVKDGVFGADMQATPDNLGGTCPGSTPECEAICYAKRIEGVVRRVYAFNSQTHVVLPIPSECLLLRIHVSGDFDSAPYIDQWIERLTERPDVTAWAYTRSWRVPALLPALERLRALPNMQLFASMDYTTEALPSTGWRRAWIYTPDQPSTGKIDKRIGWPLKCSNGSMSYTHVRGDQRTGLIFPDRTPHYACPEETGHKKNCVECGYCFEGQRHDVTFIEHVGK